MAFNGEDAQGFETTTTIAFARLMADVTGWFSPPPGFD